MHNYRNHVHLEGNLGKDAESKTTPNGKVSNFSIAVNKRWKDKKGEKHERVDWFDVEAWGPVEKFASTLKKGNPVIVEGELLPSTYTANEVKHKTFSIKANSIRKIDYNQPSGADMESGEDDAPAE